ncbi:MAG TPA: hypothetical protein VIR15_12710, partial [Intrasporangium sp.]|uniref:hypothetical protein n=1 Tax=Intrasporangium sp. TaxID=1925024 RepID=UPI002F939B8D
MRRASSFGGARRASDATLGGGARHEADGRAAAAAVCSSLGNPLDSTADSKPDDMAGRAGPGAAAEQPAEGSTGRGG